MKKTPGFINMLQRQNNNKNKLGKYHALQNCLGKGQDKGSRSVETIYREVEDGKKNVLECARQYLQIYASVESKSGSLNKLL